MSLFTFSTHKHETRNRSNHKVQDERSLDYVYSKLDHLVGFAVVRNK